MKKLGNVCVILKNEIVYISIYSKKEKVEVFEMLEKITSNTPHFYILDSKKADIKGKDWLQDLSEFFYE